MGKKIANNNFLVTVNQILAKKHRIHLLIEKLPLPNEFWQGKSTGTVLVFCKIVTKVNLFFHLAKENPIILALKMGILKIVKYFCI